MHYIRSLNPANTSMRYYSPKTTTLVNVSDKPVVPLERSTGQKTLDPDRATLSAG